MPEAIRLGGIGKVIADGLETVTGIEARSVVLRHLVCGGAPSAHDRNLATKLGIKAVEMLLATRKLGVSFGDIA